MNIVFWVFENGLLVQTLKFPHIGLSEKIFDNGCVGQKCTSPQCEPDQVFENSLLVKP